MLPRRRPGAAGLTGREWARRPEKPSGRSPPPGLPCGLLSVTSGPLGLGRGVSRQRVPDAGFVPVGSSLFVGQAGLFASVCIVHDY